MKTKKLTGLCSLFLLLMLIFSIPTPAQAAIGGPDLPTRRFPRALPTASPLRSWGLRWKFCVQKPWNIPTEH